MNAVTRSFGGLFIVAAALAVGFNTTPVAAQSAATKQAVAEAAADDKILAAFYKSIGYDTLWTGKDRDDRKRRRALLLALEDAGDHGLPVARYPADQVEAMLKKARNARDRGRTDVELTKLYLAYARDISIGILEPRRLPEPLDEEIARRRMKFDPAAALDGVHRTDPQRFIAQLAPRSAEYNRLMDAKMDLDKIVARNGWGAEVESGSKLQLGDTGPAVVALRNRLIRMGYMGRTASAKFDDKLQRGVMAFQAAHGLLADGVVGSGTLRMLNIDARARRSQVIVAMERERWMNFDRGVRHVEVNIPDYHARIIDRGVVTFETVAVVGQSKDDHRTPEFSDKMEYMVFNPSWYVPKGIAVSEYLPMLQEDPFAVNHLELRDLEGGLVDRLTVDFASLDEDSWAYWLKEPPSQGNALGLVKFMFPNRHNIYLHDTPQKSLFVKEARAFSHGCIRLEDPFGFAHALLERQSNDPDGLIRRSLAGEEELHLGLNKHVPVHLIYRTARVDAKGRMQFRNDIYGRDRQIAKYLQRAGVAF